MTTNELTRARPHHPHPAPPPRAPHDGLGRPAAGPVRDALEDAWRARVDDITRLNTELLDLHEGDDRGSAAARDVLTAQLRAAWQAAEQYEQAIARLAQGTYGTCLRCLRAISPLRLQVLPEASHCAPCQQAESVR